MPEVEGGGCNCTGVANCTRWAKAGAEAKTDNTAARPQISFAVFTPFPFATKRGDAAREVDDKDAFNTKGCAAGQERLTINSPTHTHASQPSPIANRWSPAPQLSLSGTELGQGHVFDPFEVQLAGAQQWDGLHAAETVG